MVPINLNMNLGCEASQIYIYFKSVHSTCGMSFISHREKSDDPKPFNCLSSSSARAVSDRDPSSTPHFALTHDTSTSMFIRRKTDVQTRHRRARPHAAYKPALKETKPASRHISEDHDIPTTHIVVSPSLRLLQVVGTRCRTQEHSEGYCLPASLAPGVVPWPLYPLSRVHPLA